MPSAIRWSAVLTLCTLLKSDSIRRIAISRSVAPWIRSRLSGTFSTAMSSRLRRRSSVPSRIACSTSLKCLSSVCCIGVRPYPGPDAADCCAAQNLLMFFLRSAPWLSRISSLNKISRPSLHCAPSKLLGGLANAIRGDRSRQAAFIVERAGISVCRCSHRCVGSPGTAPLSGHRHRGPALAGRICRWRLSLRGLGSPVEDCPVHTLPHKLWTAA